MARFMILGSRLNQTPDSFVLVLASEYGGQPTAGNHGIIIPKFKRLGTRSAKFPSVRCYLSVFLEWSGSEPTQSDPPCSQLLDGEDRNTTTVVGRAYAVAINQCEELTAAKKKKQKSLTSMLLDIHEMPKYLASIGNRELIGYLLPMQTRLNGLGKLLGIYG